MLKNIFSPVFSAKSFRLWKRSVCGGLKIFSLVARGRLRTAPRRGTPAVGHRRRQQVRKLRCRFLYQTIIFAAIPERENVKRKHVPFQITFVEKLSVFTAQY